MVGRPKKHLNPEDAKKAQKEKIRLWRLKNKDRIRSKVKDYHKKNPEKIRNAHLKYYGKNKAQDNLKKNRRNKKTLTKLKTTFVYINCLFCKKKVVLKNHQQKYCSDYCRGKAKRTRRKDYYLEYYKNYNRNHRGERDREYDKLYRKKYRAKFREYNEKYKKTDKGQITHLWDTLRKRVKTYTFSKVKTSRDDMDKLVGCSKIFLLNFIETKFYDHPVTNKKMTWSNIKDWHIDHITPLAILNPKNKEHFRIANHFSNLQPMWADENLKKGANIIPGYGIAYLKKKYSIIQKLGDLTKIKTKTEVSKMLERLKELNL